MSAGKGSGRRPQLANDEVFSDNWSRIFGKDKPKAGTKDREIYECAVNILAMEMVKTMPLKHEFPDQTHRCDRCGKQSMPGHIHTCSPQIKEKADVPDTGRTEDADRL